MPNGADEIVDVRLAVHAALALRHPAALSLERIRAVVERDLGRRVRVRAVKSALIYLQDLGWVTPLRDPISPETYWRATAAGVRAHECGPIGEIGPPDREDAAQQN